LDIVVLVFGGWNAAVCIAVHRKVDIDIDIGVWIDNIAFKSPKSQNRKNHLYAAEAELPGPECSKARA
jgi:hypothetical protein